MNEPLDSDKFLVDTRYGNHYHTPDCEIISMVVSPLANYVELSYSEIKNLKTNSGNRFAPHGCITTAQYNSWLSKQKEVNHGS